MQQTAPAKINLYLHVLGRRADGYHLLDSLVVFTDIGDLLEAVPAPELSLSITGPFAGMLDAQTNSVLKAARLLRDHARMRNGADIRLDKQLPVASGIGGGSSDAATALRLLAKLWNLSAHEAELAELAQPLGADMSACLRARSLHMGGIGEAITPVAPLPRFHLVLANPGLALATGKVFAAYGERFSTPPVLPECFASLEAFMRFLRETRNDLQKPAIACLPSIAKVLSALESQAACLLARMSGSGATCFGLFEQADQALGAASALQEAYPHWWVKAARIV